MAAFAAGVLTAAQLREALGDVTAEEYEYIVATMGNQLEAGELEQNEFERTLKEIVAIALLLAFLRGSDKTEAELTFEEHALIAENVRIGQQAVASLSADIVAGRYTATEEKPKPPKIEDRATLWRAAITGIVAIGMMYQAADPFLVWQVGPTEHCADCLRLNGQVHRASEWLASGWSPQSPDLQCRGYRCQCSLQETSGPSQGDF